MSGLKVFATNFVDDAVITISSGSANAQFPLSNLKNESPSRKFRSVGNSVVLMFDLIQTRALDSALFVGDPLSGLDVTSIVVKTSVNTDFSGSPTNTVTLDGLNNFGYVLFTEVSHRYVQISFTGNGTFSQVSNIFLGKQLDLLTNNFSISSFGYGSADRSSVTKNDYGQRFIDRRNIQKFLDGSIELATKGEQEDLDDIFNEVGTSAPLWLMVDSAGAAMNSGQGKLSIYGYLEKLPSWSAAGGQLWSTSLSIEAAV